MPSRIDLESLERELGPALREAMQRPTARAEFAASLRSQLESLPAHGRGRRLWIVPGRAWAALAAVVVVGLGASTAALFMIRPEPASAAAIEQLQSEAVGSLSTSRGPCADMPAGSGAGVTIANASDGEQAGAGRLQVQGPQTLSPTDVSDKLAQALGVSGDKVRQAMVDTMRAEMPASLPPDPIDGIAKNLGLSRQQVCAAFVDGQSGTVGFSVRRAGGSQGGNVTTRDQVYLGSTVFDPSTVTAQELAAPAQRLGVSPDRLLAAVKASIPAQMPEPPAPPSKEEIINRFAANLGMSPDKVSAAITQVEGPHLFYFAVPSLTGH
jgi:hypothetical protein